MANYFHPSMIENQIYSIMEDYETEGMDIYNHKVIEPITSHLAKQPKMEYEVVRSSYPDMTGGVCVVAWVEDSRLHLITFDYKYGEGE